MGYNLKGDFIIFNFKEFSIIEGLNLPLNKLIPVSVVSGAILFLPVKTLEVLHLNSFKEKWGFIIGIIFLITTALSIQEFCLKVYKKHKNKKYMKKFKKQQPLILKELSIQEMAIVAILDELPSKTLLLPINDGIIKRLESKFIITRTTDSIIGYLDNPKFPYTLNPWVSDTLKSNLDIIKFYENKLIENEVLAFEYVKCLRLENEFS